MLTVDLLGQLAAGLRLALTLLAVMVLISRVRQLPENAPASLRARRENATAWTLMALAALSYSPARAASLLDVAWVSQAVGRAGEVLASGLACASFILLLSARARLRGFDDSCITRSVRINVAIVAAFVAVAFS